MNGLDRLQKELKVKEVLKEIADLNSYLLLKVRESCTAIAGWLAKNKDLFSDSHIVGLGIYPYQLKIAKFDYKEPRHKKGKKVIISPVKSAVLQNNVEDALLQTESAKKENFVKNIILILIQNLKGLGLDRDLKKAVSKVEDMYKPMR